MAVGEDEFLGCDGVGVAIFDQEGVVGGCGEVPVSFDGVGDEATSDGGFVEAEDRADGGEHLAGGFLRL